MATERGLPPVAKSVFVLRVPSPFSEQHRDRVSAVVHDGEVRPPVPIQVPDGNGAGIFSRHEVGLGREAAVTVPEPHRDCVDNDVGDCEVCSPVPVQIPNGDRAREARCLQVGLRPEGAVAVA